MNQPAFRLDGVTLGMLTGTIVLLAFGQVLFKQAASTLQFGTPATFLTWPLFGAVVVYGLATLAWLFVLTRVPLSIAFPFYGLTFLLVPVLACLLLREPLRIETLAGGVLIAAGVVLSVRPWA